MLPCVRVLAYRWRSAPPHASSSTPTMHRPSDNDDLITCSSTKLHTVLLRGCFVKWSLVDEFKTERLCVLPRLSPLVYSCITFFFFFKEWIKHHFVFLPQISVSIFFPLHVWKQPKSFHWTLAAKQNGPWGRQRRRRRRKRWRRKRRAVVLKSTLKFSSCAPRTIGRVGMRAEKCCNGGGCCGGVPVEMKQCSQSVIASEAVVWVDGTGPSREEWSLSSVCFKNQFSSPPQRSVRGDRIPTD